jgi:hypothetical protein
MADKNWNYAGISEIKDGPSRQVLVPDPLIEELEMFTPGDPVFWSYERAVGIAIISDQKLEKTDAYSRVDNRDLQGKENSYRLTVPSEFFEDHEGRGSPDIGSSIEEYARFEPGERVHFMYTDEMAEGVFFRTERQGVTKSCYVYTDEEFEERFSDSRMGDAPRFL